MGELGFEKQPEVIGGMAVPSFVRTPEQRRRWEMCVGLARATMGGVDDEAVPVSEQEAVAMMARSVFFGPIPTDPPEQQAEPGSGDGGAGAASEEAG